MFTIYDNGENPKKSTAIGEGIRRELGAIIYVDIDDIKAIHNSYFRRPMCLA